MMRGALVVGGVLSLFWLPVFFTVLIALGGALFVPLLPVSLGLLTDVLYKAPHAVPFYTIAGAGVSFGALFVRTQLKTGIIEK